MSLKIKFLLFLSSVSDYNIKHFLFFNGEHWAEGGLAKASLPAVVQQVWRKHGDVYVLPVHRVEQSSRSMETGS